MWSFNANVAPERVQRLMAVTFGDVISGVWSGNIKAFVLEPREKVSPDEVRAAFLLEVAPDTYDAFYNAPNGYRGQYAQSEAVGATANKSLLHRIEHRLYSFAETHKPEEAKYVMPSLRCAQAKVWVDEDESGIWPAGEQTQIVFARWEYAANTYKVEGVRTKAGLFALLGTRLVVLGGWLDRETLEERYEHSKRYRAEELHCLGFT